MGYPDDVSGLLVTGLTRGVGAASGTGVAISAARFPSSSFTRMVDTVWLDGLRQDDGHRTNIGLLNPEGYGTARYRLEIFDGESDTLAATINEVTVGDVGWTQLSSFLRGAAPNVTNAYARVTREDHNGVLPFAYAVLNDGARPGLGTSDGTFIPMK